MRCRYITFIENYGPWLVFPGLVAPSCWNVISGRHFQFVFVWDGNEPFLSFCSICSSYFIFFNRNLCNWVYISVETACWPITGIVQQSFVPSTYTVILWKISLHWWCRSLAWTNLTFVDAVFSSIVSVLLYIMYTSIRSSCIRARNAWRFQ